jgi:lipoprotein-anchoring transpeptidase ErfK/SrfK
MSRSSISLLFNSGLLLATMLTATPTRINAQPNSQPSLDRSTQTSTTAQPLTNATVNSLGADSKIDRQPTEIDKSNSTQSKPVTPVIDRIPNPSAAPTSNPAVTATGSQMPVTNVVHLLLKLKEKKVYVYKGDKLLAKYPVAIGKKGTETPTGEWQVMEKIKNPAWTSFKTGEVFAPGGENPLGSRWIGFWTDGKDMVGFHGTSNLKSIGTAASNGCVRMFNRHVKALFPIVKVGTTVKVVEE